MFFLKRCWVWSRYPALVITRMASFCFIPSLCMLVVLQLQYDSMIKSVLGHFFFLSLYSFKRKLLGIFRKFRIVSVRFETVLFVSVVSIKVRNTETNRNFFFGFTKQTETNAKQILFRFVSVRTEKFYFSFRGHPSLDYATK